MADIRLPEVNKVIMTGRLTRDPELRRTASDRAVTQMGIASSRRYKARDGEWKEMTAFVNVVAWGRQAETCAEFLRKGSAVFVEGRLSSRSWETQDGQKRSTIEVQADRIQFLDRIAKPQVPEDEFVETGGMAGMSDSDDDVPF
ncbi:MAG: single-stranded DNA-binding protein [bacterium]|jgi:single-strand DNA-binding protein